MTFAALTRPPHEILREFSEACSVCRSCEKCVEDRGAQGGREASAKSSAPALKGAGHEIAECALAFRRSTFFAIRARFVDGAA